ncbi:MAG: hypothetical protein LIO43_06075 [Clostridiales bacterium]|nr:hypothetical protein [Clostridiales bacterium]
MNDKISDIMASEEGRKVFAGMMSAITEGMSGGKANGFELTNSMMKMMGGFTVIRLSGMIGAAGVKVTKEQLLDLNIRLNKIKK